MISIEPASAQGRLIGRVVDNSGTPIAAAMVYVSSAGVSQAAVTNASGYYTFLALPTGDYTVKAYKRGMPSWSKPIAISNLMIRQDIQLANAAPVELAEAKESKPEKPVEKPRPAPEPKKVEPITKSTEPAPKPVEKKVEPTPTPVAEETPTPIKQEPAPVTMALNAEVADAGLKQAIEEAKIAEASEKAVLEKRPEVVGGMSAIYAKLQYPAFARENKIEGNVMARVYVSKTGAVTKVSIIKAAHPSLSEEVFRVLNDDAKFQPASANGKAADGTVIVLVDFNLK